MGLIECDWATCDKRGLVEQEGRSFPRPPIFFSPDPARPAPAFSIDPTDLEQASPLQSHPSILVTCLNSGRGHI